jgi:glycosyltransferase involved in cell wall biosynthesis
VGVGEACRQASGAVVLDAACYPSAAAHPVAAVTRRSASGLPPSHGEDDDDTAHDDGRRPASCAVSAVEGSAAEPRLRVLIVDRSPPTDLTQGSSLIAHHLLPRLRRHHLTLICPVAPDAVEATREALAPMVDELVLIPRRGRISALGGWLEGRLAARGLRVGRPLDSRAATPLLEAIRRVVASGGIDVVHTRGLPMAGYTGGLRGRSGRLLELADSFTLAADRERSPGLRGTAQRRLGRLIEGRAVRAFEVTTAVSPGDAETLRAIAPGSRVEVVPTGVDAERFEPREVDEWPSSLVFVGAMSFGPNIAAVRWFCHDVLPRIRERRPDVTFRIVGRDPVAEVVALGATPGVIVTGYVDDVRDYLARSQVVVCPMVTGSGIKNKILEALAMARPVVTTSLGAESLEVASGRELAIADKVDDFAAGVVGLLDDGDARSRLGAAGRELVVRRYTWEACAARYDALYQELAEAHRTDRAASLAPRRGAPEAGR